MTKISKDVSLYYALLCVENNKQCLILGIKNKTYDLNDNVWLRLFTKNGKVIDKLRGDLINLNYSGLLEFKFIFATQTSCIHFNIECICEKKDSNGWMLLYKDKYYYNIDKVNDCYLNSKIHCITINPFQYTKYALVLSNNNNIDKCLKYYQGIKKVIRQPLPTGKENNTNFVKKFVIFFEKDLKIVPYVFKKCKQCFDSIQGTSCCQCDEYYPLDETFIPCGTNIIINNPDNKCNLYKFKIMARYCDCEINNNISDMKKIIYYTLNDTIKELSREEYLCPKIIIKEVLFSVDNLMNTINIKIILNDSMDDSKIALSYSNDIISG